MPKDAAFKEQSKDRSDSRDELRTIGFRLREIQRLLSMRVQQENRRLADEGIEPISEAAFFKEVEEARRDAGDSNR